MSHYSKKKKKTKKKEKEMIWKKKEYEKYKKALSTLKALYHLKKSFTFLSLEPQYVNDEIFGEAEIIMTKANHLMPLLCLQKEINDGKKEIYYIPSEIEIQIMSINQLLKMEGELVIILKQNYPLN